MKTLFVSFLYVTTFHLLGIVWWSLGVFLTNLFLWKIANYGRRIMDDKL